MAKNHFFISSTIALMSALVLTYCQCKKNQITWIEACGYDGEPLNGYIDILKFDGKNYSIQIAHIICDPVVNEEDDEETEEDLYFYPVQLEPGKYKLNFYDEPNNYTYTQLIEVKPFT